MNAIERTERQLSVVHYLICGLSLYYVLSAQLSLNGINSKLETRADVIGEIVAFFIVLYSWPILVGLYYGFGDETIEEMREDRINKAKVIKSNAE